MTKYFFLLTISLISLVGQSQNLPGSELKIKKAKGKIVIDGILNEVDWQTAQVAGDWYQNNPVDTMPAIFQSEARVTFDDDFFYVSYVCYDDTTPDVINSLRRDGNYGLNDNMTLLLGPYNDKLNGFFFTITPKGVQMEGTVANGGVENRGGFSFYWDNKWYSKVIRHETKWVAELAIPFKSFRYKSDLDEWNITFKRFDKKRNGISSWIATPIQYNASSFAYSGQLLWDDPIPPARTNISFIPYVAGGLSQNNEVEPSETSSDLQVGFDAKIGVTPSMSLDLTLNPDFSQIEVDEQILNLTRFEFQFPERRQFFLENSDLFSNAGFPFVKPFFSRRIGIVQDSLGVTQRVPILYGARLSGSLNKNWRLGVMNMQTKETLQQGLPAQNYTVATVQRMFLEQSSFSMTFVNKESLGVDEKDSLKFFHSSIFNKNDLKERLRPNTYNRVIDADLDLSSKDNKWFHSSFIAQSFDINNTAETLSSGNFFQYSGRNIDAHVGSYFVNKNFNPEVGFVPGQAVYPGQLGYFSRAQYKMYPKNEAIIYTGPDISFRDSYLPNGDLVDREYGAGYVINFQSKANLDLRYARIYQRLTFDFNPIDGARYTQFLEGEEYTWQNVSASFQSNTVKTINFLLRTTYGGFYNGTNLNIGGQLKFRYQPYGNIAMRFDYNNLNLPGNYGKEELFLIGTKLDITFTDKLFLTTYYQYNNLSENMNLNARLQWRYKPASDFFIVYTENYLPQKFASKNRALVFKLTYWINL